MSESAASGGFAHGISSGAPLPGHLAPTLSNRGFGTSRFNLQQLRQVLRSEETRKMTRELQLRKLGVTYIRQMPPEVCIALHRPCQVMYLHVTYGCHKYARNKATSTCDVS
jgi:hypothetical protein